MKLSSAYERIWRADVKVLIISDTHGRNHNIQNILERVSPIDLLIHLGDFSGGSEYIEEISQCRVEMVSGNNDFYTGYPKEKIIRIGKYTVMLTHGHIFGVNYSIDALVESAKKNKADIVMYGHTHIPLISTRDNMHVINPGSLALPRQQGRVPTYIIMDIDSKGEAHFTLNYYRE